MGQIQAALLSLLAGFAWPEAAIIRSNVVDPACTPGSVD
jgi:hypothetical protein